jgi:hypothetical protein
MRMIDAVRGALNCYLVMILMLTYSVKLQSQKEGEYQLQNAACERGRQSERTPRAVFVLLSDPARVFAGDEGDASERLRASESEWEEWKR